MKRKRKQLYWRSVFRRVLAKYEVIHLQYTATPSMNYERALDPTTIGKIPVGVVKPSTCDFVADVELAAKRALSAVEYVFFQQMYLERNEKYQERLLNKWGKDKLLRYQETVEEKVGRMFVSRRIYPMYRYFALKDLR
jgi:hypothetical protein